MATLKFVKLPTWSGFQRKAALFCVQSEVVLQLCIDDLLSLLTISHDWNTTLGHIPNDPVFVVFYLLCSRAKRCRLV